MNCVTKQKGAKSLPLIAVFMVIAMFAMLGCQAEQTTVPTASPKLTPAITERTELPSPTAMPTSNAELESWKSRALKAEEVASKSQDEVAKIHAEIEKSKPKLPDPTPLALDHKTTALLVLDLNNRCKDPAQVCSQLAPLVKDFLPKTRQAGVLTIYTVSASAKGTPLGGVLDDFGALPDEPVVYPDAFDKFVGGEIKALLDKQGIKTVIITGASTNFAVLYTATSAARMYGYNVVIPTDGVIANTKYENDYTLYQFTVLPGGASQRFSFTTLGAITFK